MSAHSKTKRAEAAVKRWKSATPSPDLLVEAADGLHLHLWQPVQGPHLRVVRTKDRRNKTGVVGVSETRTGGRRYYEAQLGPTSRKFNIDTLGRADAFRRAVAARAEHEMKVRRANAVILAARNAVKNDASAMTTLKTDETSFAADSRRFAEGV